MDAAGSLRILEKHYIEPITENSRQATKEGNNLSTVETVPRIMEEQLNQPNIGEILESIENEDKQPAMSDIPHIMEVINPEVQAPERRRRGRPRIHPKQPISEMVRPSRPRGRPRRVSRPVTRSTIPRDPCEASASKRRPVRPTRQQAASISPQVNR